MATWKLADVFIWKEVQKYLGKVLGMKEVEQELVPPVASHQPYRQSPFLLKITDFEVHQCLGRLDSAGHLYSMLE